MNYDTSVSFYVRQGVINIGPAKNKDAVYYLLSLVTFGCKRMVHPKLKMHTFPFIHSAVYLSKFYWCELLLHITVTQIAQSRWISSFEGKRKIIYLVN